MAYNKTKQSFVIYESFYDAAMHLDDEEFREYMLRLKDYAIYGMDEESENKMINGLMAMAMPLLDAAEKRRKTKAENGQKGAEYGQLGGRPRKGETAAEYRERKLQEQKTPNETPNETPTITPTETPKKPLNVNANVNVNENENAKVNEDVNDNANENANAEGEDAAESRDEKQSNVFSLADLANSHIEFDDTRVLEGQREEMKGPQQEVISPYSKDMDIIPQTRCTGEEPRRAADPTEPAEPTKTELELINEMYAAAKIMARYDRRQATQDEYNKALHKGIQAMMICGRLTREEAKSKMMEAKRLVLEGRI